VIQFSPVPGNNIRVPAIHTNTYTFPLKWFITCYYGLVSNYCFRIYGYEAALANRVVKTLAQVKIRGFANNGGKRKKRNIIK
jgi:hypothetical protein